MPPKTRKSASSNAVVRGRNEKKPSAASISKKIHEEGTYDEEELEKVQKKKESKINAAMDPALSPLQNTQVEFVKGVFNFLITNFTSENFIVSLLIGFIINLMYVRFSEAFEVEINTVAFCWLGALTSYVVSYITQQRAITAAVRAGTIDADSPLAVAKAPSFDRLIATTLPVMVCFFVNKDLLVINLGLTYLLLELPVAIKMFVSMTVMYNFQMQDDFLSCTFVPCLHYVLDVTLEYYVENSFTPVERHTFSVLFINLMYAVQDNSNPVLVILKYLVYWFGGLSFISFPVASFIKKQDSQTAKSILLGLFYAVFIAGFYSGVVFSLSPVLGENPLVWLKNFITATELRFNIFKIWSGCFVTLIPLVFKVSSSFDIQLRRKIWHFILFAMLLYPLIVDPELVKLSLVGLIGVFTALELLRASALPPLGPALQTWLEPFQDDRDSQGPVVFSHLFLLIGVALPVFLSDSPAGLVALGLGDSLASIVGKKIGEVNWFDSKKTIEGSIAFIFGSTAALYAYVYLGGTDYSWNTLFMSAVFTALFEGMSSVNDNLVAPVYMYLMLEVLHQPEALAV